MVFISKSPKKNPWTSITQSLRLLTKTTCYPFLWALTYIEGIPLRRGCAEMLGQWDWAIKIPIEQYFGHLSVEL